jgi:hypothetical protein
MGMLIFILISLLILTPIFLGIVWALCILCQLVVTIFNGLSAKPDP